MTLQRRTANELASCLRKILPDYRAAWGVGIENELLHIQHDGEALRWVFGALVSACLERATALASAPVSRAFLCFPILFQALGAAFAPSLLLAWRGNHLQAAALLGSQTPGDDFHRFIPLLAILPAWYVTLGLFACLLFLASAVQLLRRSPSALALFLAALALELLSEAAVRLLPGYLEISHQVFSFPNQNFRRDVLIPAATSLLPLLVAATLGLAQRSQPPATPPSLSSAEPL